ncbi:MAG: glycoside hydrolase family 32 protein [Clostridia bacterium]|nr:glycoside hydrolase family 32 protein [Clostridia bacterium]
MEMKETILGTRAYREKMIADPYRPGYHFAIPDDLGIPGDPNGAFYADGRYHLMYLYRNSGSGGFHWGHMSSADLLHWRHHKDALTTQDGDGGCFSGGAFVDEDGTAYLTFWKFAAVDPAKDRSGIAMAYAKPPYDDWYRMEPIAINGTEWGILELEIDGKTDYIGNADPSNIWKKDGWYYMQTGNLCVLNKYGRAEDSDERLRGDWTDLFRSKDLKTWEYLHRFYKNPHAGEDWPDATEDDMCPSFLPLPDREQDGVFTDKWLQLFIAHNKGAQYYVGSLSGDGETFLPEQHGRMSWRDNTCFAPEALIDDRNRQIAWFWLTDNLDNDFDRFGWSGVYSLPRTLWLENGVLHTAPVRELERLQYNPQHWCGNTDVLPVKNGESFRLTAVFEAGSAESCGFAVRCSADGTQETRIYADPASGKLVMDTTDSGTEGRRIREEAPFALASGEPLVLDIFADKSVVEVFANQRQAICRRVYPTAEDATGVKVIGGRHLIKADAWEMMPSNPY